MKIYMQGNQRTNEKLTGKRQKGVYTSPYTIAIDKLSEGDILVIRLSPSGITVKTIRKAQEMLERNTDKVFVVQQIDREIRIRRIM